jgi:glycerophosphoryl diester phosphodiesterase
MGLNKGSYIILYFIATLVMLITIFFVYSSLKFERLKPSNAIDEMQIWSHRGIHHTLQENTIEAFHLAKTQGFKGVELDVFFDDDLGLVVSHDFPYQVVDGKVLRLTAVIDSFYNDFSFWIDLKNLDAKNVKAIASAFEMLFKEYPTLSQHVFVESAKGWQLHKLSKVGVQGIYWVQFSRHPLKQFFKIYYLKSIIAHADFFGITSDYRYLDEPFKRIFGHLNWYIFTVNEKSTIEELAKIPAIKVILTDLEGEYVFK